MIQLYTHRGRHSGIKDGPRVGGWRPDRAETVRQADPFEPRNRCAQVRKERGHMSGFKSQRLLLSVVAALGGCASAPHYSRPLPGQTIGEGTAAQKSALKRPSFLFLADTHRFAVYGVDANGALDESGGRSTSMLVFEDDRYLGELYPDDALRYPACLAQRGGTVVLGERLRALTARQPDPLLQRMPDGVSFVGEVQCPSELDVAPTATPTMAEQPEPSGIRTASQTGLTASQPDQFWQPLSDEVSSVGDVQPAPEPEVTPAVAEEPKPSAMRNALETAAVAVVGIPLYTGFIVVSLAAAPVVIPLAVGAAGAVQVHDWRSLALDRRSLAAQEQIDLDMGGADIARLMGQPTAVFYLDPAHTEVRYFARRSPNNQGLWIGLDGGRVVWIRFSFGDAWLTATKDRLLKAQDGSREAS